MKNKMEKNITEYLWILINFLVIIKKIFNNFGYLNNKLKLIYLNNTF